MKQKLRKLFTAATGSLSVMLGLALVTAIAINSIGTLMSGSVDVWLENLADAAPWLTTWRSLVYIVVGSFAFDAYNRYRRNGNKPGIARVRRLILLGIGVVVINETANLHMQGLTLW